MKKQNTNPEVQTTETTASQTETVNTEKKATKATTKKEEKKMSSTKKSETATITIPESIDQNLFKAYRLNDQNEVLMTGEMFDEFKQVNAETLRFGTQKSDKDIRLVAPIGKGTKAFAKVRIDETAKKKQVHIHTGATKKVCSQKDEKSGIRYKVILRDKTQKFELWSADAAGKRKMVKRGTEAEVMAEYNKLLGIKAETKVTGKTTKGSKKSA